MPYRHECAGLFGRQRLVEPRRRPSDGLVRINNAVVFNEDKKTGESIAGPRAYVHRSHSGYYGIVNSEEGYQNLVRFLFGNVRVDGALEVEEITLPEDLDPKKQTIHASYHFEAVSRVRGAHWDLSRRVLGENSTVFRTMDELFPKNPADAKPYHRRPELFTAFLSKAARVDPKRRSLGFAIDLSVLVPDYEVDGILWLRNHYPGGHIFRDKVNLEVIPPANATAQWALRYGFDSQEPNGSSQTAERITLEDGIEFRIPIVQQKQPGIKATMVITAREWNSGPR